LLIFQLRITRFFLVLSISTFYLQILETFGLSFRKHSDSHSGIIWEMHHVFRLLHSRLVRWARRKYKRYKTSICRAYEWLKRIKKQFPYLFYHWRLSFAI
jgi:hypothetical protein